MRKQKHQIQEAVEKTIACFDHMEKLKPNPFFFTRLEASLDAQQKPTGRLKGALQSAWVIAFILINIVSIIVLSSDKAESGTTRADYLQEIATDLTINQPYIDPFEQEN